MLHHHRILRSLACALWAAGAGPAFAQDEAVSPQEIPQNWVGKDIHGNMPTGGHIWLTA